MAGAMSKKPVWQAEPVVNTVLGPSWVLWVLTPGHLHFLDAVVVSKHSSPQGLAGWPSSKS